MIDERSKMINECFPNISEAEKQVAENYKEIMISINSST